MKVFANLRGRDEGVGGWRYSVDEAICETMRGRRRSRWMEVLGG